MPRGVPPIEGQQETNNYPKWYKNATGKGLWSGKSNGVP